MMPYKVDQKTKTDDDKKEQISDNQGGSKAADTFVKIEKNPTEINKAHASDADEILDVVGSFTAPKDMEPIVIDDDEDDDDRSNIKPPQATKEVEPKETKVDESTAKGPAIMTVKRHPVRETRSKITTYNDILNSIDPNHFESDFRSEGDDDVDSTSVPEYHSVLHSKSQRPTNQLSISRPAKLSNLYQKPLGKRRFLKTGFVYDTAMSYHATPDPMEIHPEDPSRIFRIFNIIERNNLLKECKEIDSRRATKQEILLVHNILHYRKLRETAGIYS